MATSPSTSADRPSIQGFRRSSSSFTSLPTRSLSLQERAGLDRSDAAAEILYTHENVKIFTFQPPEDKLKQCTADKTLPDADYPIDAIEVLPWRSRTESLQAAGKMIVEKVRGSVHFLKSGSAVYTLMRNSQIWCVDGEAKFVMRTGHFKYNRIEFPCATEEDKRKITEFKDVVSRILKFERTPCPFVRAFSVELPEDAITPRRKGQWKRTVVSPELPDEERLAMPRRTRSSRTASMQSTPPSAFPTRLRTALEADRPRTASSPLTWSQSHVVYLRDHSPASVRSEDATSESERHDSESERPEDNEANTSDPETSVISIGEPRNSRSERSSPVSRKLPVKALREQIERRMESRSIVETPNSTVRGRTGLQTAGVSTVLHEDSPGIASYQHQDNVQGRETIDYQILPEQPSSQEESPQLDSHQEPVITETTRVEETKVELIQNKLEETETICQEAEPVEHTEIVPDAEPDAFEADSFHTAVSQYAPPTPQHRRGLSEVTIKEVPATGRDREDDKNDLTPPQTPTLKKSPSLDYSWLSASTPGGFDSSADSDYRRLPQRRTLSVDLHGTAWTNLPSRQPTLPPIVNNVQKAVSFVVTKPIDAVVLLVHILGRIIQGATIDDVRSGELFRMPAPVHRAVTVPHHTRNNSTATSEEDDFGVPLPFSERTKGRNTSSHNTLEQDVGLRIRTIRSTSDDGDIATPASLD